MRAASQGEKVLLNYMLANYKTKRMDSLGSGEEVSILET